MPSGKHKGIRFERVICRELSLWITNGKRDDVLWRSAISGGRATVAINKGNKNLAHVSGDVCAVHEDGYPFVGEWFVEIKHYRDMQLPRLLTAQAGRLSTFWTVAKREARRHGKRPMLVWKQNQQRISVVFDNAGYDRLGLKLGYANVVIPALDMVTIPLAKLATFPFTPVATVKKHSRMLKP